MASLFFLSDCKQGLQSNQNKKVLQSNQDNKFRFNDKISNKKHLNLFDKWNKYVKSILNLKNKKVFLDSVLFNRKYSSKQNIGKTSLNTSICSLGL